MPDYDQNRAFSHTADRITYTCPFVNYRVFFEVCTVPEIKDHKSVKKEVIIKPAERD